MGYCLFSLIQLADETSVLRQYIKRGPRKLLPSLDPIRRLPDLTSLRSTQCLQIKMWKGKELCRRISIFHKFLWKIGLIWRRSCFGCERVVMPRLWYSANRTQAIYLSSVSI